MRLQGKRRLRSPKLKITPRKPRKAAEKVESSEPADAAATEPASEPVPAPEPEPEPEENWTLRMSREDLENAAKEKGIEIQEGWNKPDIIEALKNHQS